MLTGKQLYEKYQELSDCDMDDWKDVEFLHNNYNNLANWINKNFKKK